MTLGSTFVWFGLILAYISGALLFFTNPEFYMQSDKFLAKFSIVLIITINGYIFHKWHLPHLKKHREIHLPTSKNFTKKHNHLLSSGVISVISWISAIILGSWRDIHYSYIEIMIFYLSMTIISILFVNIFMRNKIFPKKV